MDALLSLPKIGPAGPDGWAEETLRFRATPKPHPKFNGPIDARAVLGERGSTAVVTTRVGPKVDGAIALELTVRLELKTAVAEDRFRATWSGTGLRSAHLHRTIGASRSKQIDFATSPFPLPPNAYPEVLLPFLMRGQSWDVGRRSLYAWTSDRFCARTYYEARGQTAVTVPAGTIPTTEVWLYPDLNDWVALGGLLTKLAKPFLPRYDLWFERAAPHRPVRFEGAYGPPGAPEIILELAP